MDSLMGKKTIKCCVCGTLVTRQFWETDKTSEVVHQMVPSRIAPDGWLCIITLHPPEGDEIRALYVCTGCAAEAKTR